MAHKIFISLTAGDTPIAEALRSAFAELFGDFLQVHFSTSKELDGGIRSGEDWFQWIVDRVADCDFALILVTPSSVHKPWILWEAGAVAGAALASRSGEALRKVRPLVYQLQSDMIPSPIRDSKVQFRRGDSADAMRRLFKEILDEYRSNTQLSSDRVTEFGERLRGAIDTYMGRVMQALLDAPAVPTPTMLDEWRQRLDTVAAQNRASEVRHLHDWIDIAFGRSGDDRPRPLDLRLHMRLADLYLKDREYARAIEQLRLARELAPRDIFVLRSLGRACLEVSDRAGAKEVLDRIVKLDPDAFVHNTECAALAGRFYRSGGDHRKAAEIYRAALAVNTDSYYLANLVAESCLEAGDLEGARDGYRQALKVIGRLNENNVWTLATAANAQLCLGEDDALRESLRRIHAMAPGADALASIERGLRTVAAQTAGGEPRLQMALALLHP